MGARAVEVFAVTMGWVGAVAVLVATTVRGCALVVVVASPVVLLADVDAANVDGTDGWAR